MEIIDIWIEICVSECVCVRDQRNRGSLCLSVLQWFQRSRDDQSWRRWFYLTMCCVESKMAPLIYFEFHHHHRTVLALKSSTKWDRPTQFKRYPLLQTQFRSCCFVWQRIDADGALWFRLRSPSEFQVICGRVCVRLRACFCRHLCNNRHCKATPRLLPLHLTTLQFLSDWEPRQAWSILCSNLKVCVMDARRTQA